MHRALRVSTVSLVAGACAVACGSSTQSATQTPTPATNSSTPSEPFSPPSGTTSTPTPGASSNGTYTVQVALTGGDAVQGTFTETLSASASSTAHCPVPSDLSGSVGSRHVELQMTISSGPSTQQTLSPGDIQLIVDGDTWGVASASNAPHGSSGSLQRNADGSGSASFQNLALQSDPSHQPQESGSINWTCA